MLYSVRLCFLLVSSNLFYVELRHQNMKFEIHHYHFVLLYMADNFVAVELIDIFKTTKLEINTIFYCYCLRFIIFMNIRRRRKKELFYYEYTIHFSL